ncbi:hypothetical protein [Aequorivita marina]|uniref:hypothetical protein n=1 Tax=Aequorivita marina TaxID=3073654 RepID=UPI002874F44C|nr:hypothetical protein [Aequorivita sp. S2608]MDS1296860.1 hypothetical protein [Aequorivita sp. S2608]
MQNYRLENNRFEKNIKFFKWGAIITMFLAIMRIGFDSDIFKGSATFGDFILTLIPVGLFLQYRQTAKKWGGQFIEWTDNQIIFKSRKYDETTIEIDDIESIDIKLDMICIKTKEKNYEINIEDYTKYEDRFELKSQFEIVNEKLKHNTGNHCTNL